MTPLRFLFGEDLFISYSRSDATAYAASLASELTSGGFSCFLDQWGTEPGQKIPPRVLRSLDRSSMLVLVGSPEAARSEAVEREVRRFLKKGRPIVPISIGGALEASSWFSLVDGASMSMENPMALEEGSPSPAVLNRIQGSFRFTRRNQRVRRAFLGAATGLLVLIGVAGWATHQANQRLLRALSVELAASSRSQLATEPDLAALLAVASLKTDDTFEARRALFSAITERPLLEALLISPAQGRQAAREHRDTGRIRTAWFSRDGTQVAIKDWDHRITVWSLKERPFRGKVLDATVGLRNTQISPDFRLVAGLNRDRDTVYVRPVRDSSSRSVPKTVFTTPADQHQLALSPDGRWIALGSSDGVVTLWDASSGEQVGDALSSSNRTVSENPNVISLVSPILALRFSGDGQTLYWADSSGNRGAAEVPSGHPTEPLPPEAPLDATGWSADGQDLVIEESHGGLSRAHLYQGEISGSLRPLIRRPPSESASVSAAAIGADGSMIAGGRRNGAIDLFDRLASISPSAVLRAHTGTVTALALSPDGTHLVSGSDDGTVALWRTRAGPLERTLREHPEFSVGYNESIVRFTSDGAKLLVTRENGVVVFNRESEEPDGEPIVCEDLDPTSLAIVPDSHTVAIGDLNEIHLADLSTRRCPERPMRPRIRTGTGFVRALAVSPDGSLLASGGNNGGLALWDLERRTQLGEHLNRPDNDQREISSLAWLPGEHALIVGSPTLPRLWPTGVGHSAEPSLEGGARRSRTVTGSRDGRLLAGSSGDGVYLWDSTAGHVQARFALDKRARDIGEDSVSALALSASAELLAVGQDGSRLSLFDLDRMQWLGDLPPPPGCGGCSVDSLDFGPDDRLLAVAMERRVLLWPLTPGAWARRACEIANRRLTPDERSRYLGSASVDSDPC